MSDYRLHHGDMLEVLPTLEKGSVAMVFADLPYGVTRAAWDVKLDVRKVWCSLRAVTASSTPLVFTAIQPFSSFLVTSNASEFRYEMIWRKPIATGHLSANRRPMRCHENLLVFSAASGTYNPQMRSGSANIGAQKSKATTLYSRFVGRRAERKEVRHPLSILEVASPARMTDRIHPTQKPVALLEWLIATYTNPGDLVVDPCFGSNTTGVACARLGRRYIGIEKDATYFAAGKARLEAEHARLTTTPPQGDLAV